MEDSFFGTDGIRGLTSIEAVSEADAVAALDGERTLTPAFMRLVGEALSYTQPALPGEGSVVVVGWDRRPHNASLVAALTLGLRLTGSTVVHIGACATPTLHHAVLAFGARQGCMITASHNPVSDSGIKIFDAHGYKSSRSYEEEVSRTVRQLAEEDRDVDAVDRERLSLPDDLRAGWGLMAHAKWMKKRWKAFETLFGPWSGQGPEGRCAPTLLIDGANGFATEWLAGFLSEQGVACAEVGSATGVLNDACGAGDFSPTQTWTFDEAKASPHALIRRLERAEPGQLVGAALDGDGDRCLLIQATERGFAVVDGDAIGALMLSASAQRPWSFAASIESDIGLFGHACSVNPDTSCVETAVGDRWLAYALRPVEGEGIQSDGMPLMCGIEDSGHVVLPAPHPLHDGVWSLVGDGAATLCAALLAAGNEKDEPFPRGWKQRVSVKDSRRERWSDGTALFTSTEKTIMHAMERMGFNAQRRRINGEKDLLLIHGESAVGVASFGVRNSGTQAKTSLSVRLSRGLDAEPFEALLDDVKTTLTEALTGLNRP